MREYLDSNNIDLLGEAVYTPLFADHSLYTSDYPPFMSFKKLANYFIENSNEWKSVFKLSLIVPVEHIVKVEESDSFVDISIYDMRGNLVKNLVKKFQKSGKKSIVWNTLSINRNNVPTGLYIYKLKAGESIYAKKMLLLK